MKPALLALASLVVLCACATTADNEVSPEIAAATSALSETGSTLAELTEAVATAGVMSSMGTPMRDGSPAEREMLANNVAMMTAAEQGAMSCVTTETTLAPLAVTMTYAGCTSAGGEPLSGVMRIGVDSWNPLVLSIQMEDLQVGDDRTWAGATLSLPAADTGLDPSLDGAFVVVRPTETVYLAGRMQFGTSQTTYSGSFFHKEGGELDAMNRLIFRVGESGVSAAIADVVFVTGECAPSGGSGSFEQAEIIGITTGAMETTDDEELILDEQLAVSVTFLPTTPTDGVVEATFGALTLPYTLYPACAP